MSMFIKKLPLLTRDAFSRNYFSKSTDRKFGLYIHRIHPNKSPLTLWKKGAWACPGSAQYFCKYPLYIISGTGKATNFEFPTHIHKIDRNKSLLKISGKVAVGVLRDWRVFRAPIHRAHRAVIFAVAQLSCSHWLRWSSTHRYNSAAATARPVMYILKIAIFAIVLFLCVAIILLSIRRIKMNGLYNRTNVANHQKYYAHAHHTMHECGTGIGNTTLSIRPVVIGRNLTIHLAYAPSTITQKRKNRTMDLPRPCSQFSWSIHADIVGCG